MKLSDLFIDERLDFRIKGFISQLTGQPFDYDNPDFRAWVQYQGVYFPANGLAFCL
jgi:hypothetical protein